MTDLGKRTDKSQARTAGRPGNRRDASRPLNNRLIQVDAADTSNLGRIICSGQFGNKASALEANNS